MQIGKFDKVIGINAILRHFNGKIYVLQSICKSSHITVLSPYVLSLVYTIRVTRYPHHFFLTLVWRRRERDGTRASESHWSRSVFRTPCHSGARKAFHLAPPFGQKEARNEHSELGSLFTIRVTRRSRPVSTYGDNTVLIYRVVTSHGDSNR